MKITEEELIEELESLRDNAQEGIEENYKMRLSQNTYGMGYAVGERDTCQRILRYMREGFEE